MRPGVTTSSSGGTDPPLPARMGPDPGHDRVIVETPPIPPAVAELLGELWDAGHAAYVVGGCLRDVYLGRDPSDWDLTTDARPERIVELLRGAQYENRFGTVVVIREGEPHEVTTFRSDHEYADHRRPRRVEFGDRIEDDLARRDFTVNAMAWGRRPDEAPGIVDPFDGRRDIERRVLRAVGEPAARFREDALRMMRAVRLAATLDFSIEPATLAAITANAALARHLSGERVATELDKLLAARTPSIGLRLLDETGLLDVHLPEIAAQRGIPQNKITGDDLLAHTLRTVDAVAPEHPVVRLAALFHDIGKPATQADGHFRGHDAVGASMVPDVAKRLRMPRAVGERIAHLVRQHMFSYEPAWSDAAVRRFIMRVGPAALDQLFELRIADDVGSGLPARSPALRELRRRVREQLDSQAALRRGDLAVHGDDLIAELGIARGPLVGILLDALLEHVVADPGLNRRETLLALARGMVSDEA